jgi:hypothetical protein
MACILSRHCEFGRHWRWVRDGQRALMHKHTHILAAQLFKWSLILPSLLHQHWHDNNVIIHTRDFPASDSLGKYNRVYEQIWVKGKLGMQKQLEGYYRSSVRNSSNNNINVDSNDNCPSTVHVGQSFNVSVTLSTTSKSYTTELSGNKHTYSTSLPSIGLPVENKPPFCRLIGWQLLNNSFSTLTWNQWHTKLVFLSITNSRLNCTKPIFINMIPW